MITLQSTKWMDCNLLGLLIFHFESLLTPIQHFNIWASTVCWQDIRAQNLSSGVRISHFLLSYSKKYIIILKTEHKNPQGSQHNPSSVTDQEIVLTINSPCLWLSCCCRRDFFDNLLCCLSRWSSHSHWQHYRLYSCEKKNKTECFWWF